MTQSFDEIDEDDPRLLQVSREYLAELESGRKPDRSAYLTRFPDLADALADCLDGIELAHALGAPDRTESVEFSSKTPCWAHDSNVLSVWGARPKSSSSSRKMFTRDGGNSVSGETEKQRPLACPGPW